MQVNGRADHIEDYLCTVRTGENGAEEFMAVQEIRQ